MAKDDFEVGMLSRNKDGSWNFPKCKKCKRKVASRIDGMCQTCYMKSIGKEFKHKQYYMD